MSAEARQVKFLASDREAFAYVHPYIDKRPTDEIVAHVENGYILKTHEQREIYSFNAPEIGEVLFDVRGVKDAVVRKELRGLMLEVDLDKNWVDYIRANGGVEAEHMARLTAADLKRPGVAVLWANGFTTMIDGNNRLVRRYDDGLRTFRFLRLDATRELWGRYMCRPGEEEKFFTAAKPRPNVTVLSKQVITR